MTSVKIHLYTLIIVLAMQSACAQMDSSEINTASISDPQALTVADDVMKAIGGQNAWDKTRYLSWKFFGVRKLTWDRFNGDVRIHDLKTDTKILMNVRTGLGKVCRSGKILADSSAECRKALETGKRILINDSYWLIMPMKLKDPGVHLKYLGKGKTEAGEVADILQMTFDEVGVTPENKYLVFVDVGSRLVTQWSFFKKASDEKPEFSSPWTDYRRYGKILLSSGRGSAKRSLDEIQVHRKLPASSFTKF